MLLTSFLALRSAIMLPGDLVDSLHARHGYAFVAVSGVAPVPLHRIARDEVQMTNLARSRWDLKADYRRGIAVGYTLPYRALFDDRAGMIARPAPRHIPAKDFARPGGVEATVEEILLTAGRSSEDVHWCVRRRRVAARFNAGDLPKLLPQLAEAAGGEYKEKANRIEFDPRAYRRQGLATLARRMSDPDHDVFIKGYLDPLFSVALRNISDADLISAFATPGTMVFVAISPSDATGPEVRSYLDVKFRQFGSQADEIRSRIDFGALPKVMFSSAGAAGLQVRQKGSDVLLVF